MHEYKAKLSSARNRSLESFARVWRASKVELKGGYSIQRLRALSQYCDNNSSKPFRAAAIMLVTPLPCLGAILLADSLPLSPPGQGIVHNKVFWLRAFVGAWFFTISFVVQFSQSLPMLSMTRRRVFVITWVVSIGGTAVVMALSLAVGFPMPFMMVLATPGWIAFLVGSLAVQWGSAIRANPSVWPMVLNCLKVFSIQMSLLVVYPVYNYFFQKLRGTEQALFSLVLHIIKIGAKNAIGRYFTHMEDMRPEVVIFNVEVFSALFTSLCMQNATSLLTTLILVLADFGHACVSLYDVKRRLGELDELEHAMNEAGKNSEGRKSSRNGGAMKIDRRAIAPDNAVDALDGENVLSRTMDLLTRSGTIGAFKSGPRLLSSKSSIWGRSGNTPTQTRQSNIPVGQLDRWMRAVASFIRRKVRPSDEITRVTVAVAPTAQTLKRASTQARLSFQDGIADLTRSRSLMSKMTPLSIPERQYVEKVVELLHLTEFTILVEYTEVIIPAVYGECKASASGVWKKTDIV